jgi:hypothetical protein
MNAIRATLFRKSHVKILVLESESENGKKISGFESEKKLIRIDNTDFRSPPPPPLKTSEMKGATTVKKRNNEGGRGGKQGRGRGNNNDGGGTAAAVSGVGRGGGGIGNLSKTMSNLTIDNSVNAVRTWTAAVEQQQQKQLAVATPASSDGDDSFSKFIRDD